MRRMRVPNRLQCACVILLALVAIATPAFAPDPPFQALARYEVLLEGLQAPRYLAVDSYDVLLISKGGPGEVLQVAPNGTVTVLIDRLNDPTGLAVEPDGTVFVAAERERGAEGRGQHGVILRRDTETGALSVVASDFKDPRGLTLDPNGTLFMSAKGRRGEQEERGAIYSVDIGGSIALRIDGFKDPQGILVAPDNSLLVVAEQFGRRPAAIEGSLFQVDPTGQVTSLVQEPLKDPFGVARDPLDGLYVSARKTPGSESERGVILKRRPDGQEVIFAQDLRRPRGLAFDSQGHLYVAEAGQQRILKFLAPAPPTLQPPPPASTNQPTILLQGTSEPGALLTVQGSSQPVTGLADTAGVFSLRVPLATNRTNRLTLFATGASGDGLTSAPTSVTVIQDNLLPTVSIAAPAASAVLRGTVPFTADATDGSGIALVTLKVDGVTLLATNAPPFTTSLDTTLMADGGHTLSAIAHDKAGNEAIASISVVSDNTLPVLTITAPTEGSTISTSTPTLSLAYSDATSGVSISTLQVTLDGLDLTSAFTVSATAATATLTTPLAGGPHTLQVSLADLAGNLRTATSRFTVSTGTDFTLTVAPALGAVVQGIDTTFAVSIVAVNAYSHMVRLSVSGLPGGATATFTPIQVAPNASSDLAVSVSTSLAPGVYPFTVTGTGLMNGVLTSRKADATLTVLSQGITALSGRVLTTEEVPLPNVTIRLGALAALTDGAGNFLITDPPTGQQVILIDGSTASTSAVSYPTIPVTVTIAPGQVTSLGFTPHLHVQPVSRTAPLIPGQAASITDPAIPGLTVQIPAGVTIVGWDGQPNTQIGMRVVPPDRSPLPHLDVPTGAMAGPIYMFYFGKVGGGTPTAPVPIIGPNDGGGLPGEQVDLYFYDEAPDGSRPNQWAKYGTGTVSADGTQIIPDTDPATGRPYGMPRFCCGAWRVVYPPPQNRPPSTAAPSLPALGQGPSGGEPVDLATGLFILHKTELLLPGRVPIAFTRSYRTLDASLGPFGPGTSHTYDVFLQTLSADAVLLTLPGNSRALFARQPDGTFSNATEPGLRGASIVTAADSSRRLTFKDGSIWTLDANGRLIAQQDRNGNTLTLTRDGQGRLTTLTDPAGRRLTLSYDGMSLLIRALTDPLGRTVRYSYDGSGRLTTVTDPTAGVTSYTYDSADRLTTITDPRGIVFLRNEYDANGRVSRQVQADGGVWSFTYTLTSGVVTATRVTDPLGHTTASRFHTSGHLIAQTDALGQTTTFEREPGTNLLLSTTDPLGRVTRFTYDAQGNVATITDPQGNVRTFTYEPTFNRLTTLTDPLGQTTRFAYDGQGNLTSLTDPLGQTTTITSNAVGQPIATTDPLGNSTRFDYDAVGNLVTITDPLGHVTTRAYDAVSRLLTQTDPRGNQTTFAYDALNRLMQLIDADNGMTRFTYDGNGNLLTVTDALSHAITHSYDSMDRLATRTDPLGRGETFTYDGNGNLTSTTDRKGQSTQFEYDPLNRRVKSTFADGTASTVTYDAAGRLVHADDSADPHRPITLSYDVLDRLMAETTALGTVSYQYDPLGRRTQMTVNGLNPVTYTYDTASRMRTITQAPLNPVSIDYDAMGRRTKLTLPNGVNTEYQYDAASRLTALIYRNATGVLGDLTYTYDATGNRTGVGGSFARTLLPDPVASAMYDSANEQMQFGDKTMTYDANGNLTTITDPSGVTTFTWDVRNRLVGLAGPGLVASFSYDQFGRRVSKEINGELGTYQYDGADPVRVGRGGSELTYLHDLQIDGLLFRSDRTGFLADGLGSMLALTNSDGTPMTQYRYGPFGASQVEGVLDANPFQFTGRENDGTGLLFFRARYYSPILSRFLSEDPVTLDHNVSLYAYVRNAPMRFVDPFGLEPMGPNGKLYYGPWQHYGEPGWFHVYATREGQVGRRTATQHLIGDTDVFAALPSTVALNRTVEIEYNGKSLVAPVWEVGPWSTDDPYWEGNGVPKALLGERTKQLQDLYGPPRNPAGIDLSNQAFRNLGLKDNAWVWWRFANHPTQGFPSGSGADRIGGRK